MADTLIQARRLNTYYGASHVLRDVDFTLHSGEALGLLGRNGMGKTTLIKTLLGLLKPRSGQLAVRGRDMTGAPPYRIAQAGVAYVPEGRGIFPTLSVIENLVMAARPGVDGRRDWTLERVLQTFPRLAERRHHGGTQLSGGEQQMLSIGRALMTNPFALFLDEATEGLAPLVVAEIWRIIGSIRESGIATVVVDKNFRSVLRATDRAVILVKGQVALEAPSAQLREDPARLAQYLGV
ncbi:MAG TPA: ABC transporter ATP-binding protein [Burkholderiaceae bacterium]|nr:ABC transporter ATP-binding protein [Burkholderiaceae bacterium]